jgi:hypothetical protein
MLPGGMAGGGELDMGKKKDDLLRPLPSPKCDGSVSCAPENQNQNASAGSGRKTVRPAARIVRRSPKGSR